jgi:6-phosphogluconolactonase
MVRPLLRTAALFACTLLVPAYGGGGGGGAGILSSVARFAYLANRGDNTVSIYTVNAGTGQLRANGYVAAGSSPRSVTVDPGGKFAYAANFGSEDVSAFSIDAATGALSAVTGSPFAAGLNSYSMTTTGTIQ